MRQAFALVDCNNFYVSCERVFDPRLIKRPVIVLSNNDGCVIARSEEAKTIGIKMGVPIFQINHLIEEYGVRVLSSNYALYGDMSARVMATLNEFTADVEVYSIDEAFMLLSCQSVDAWLTETGRRIKERVYRYTGIPVSVGIAWTKTLAKIANRAAKKSRDADGVIGLTAQADVEAALRDIPVSDIWGIGRQYAKMLEGKGVTNALALRDVDARWARRTMTVVGARLVEELRGVSCLPLELVPPSKRSVTVSRSFGRQVESLAEMREAVAAYTVRAAEKLRRHGLAAGAVTVFLSTNRFDKNAPQYSNSATVEVACPSDATQELLSITLDKAERLYREGFKFKKAGVMFSGLVPATPMTVRMYDEGSWQRARRLSRAVDAMNLKFGRDTIKFGAAGLKQRWKTKFEKRTPRYTTDWRELLTIG